MIELSDIRSANQRIADQIERTPLEYSETLSALTGVELYLKFENRQFTASFKERGALNRLLTLSAQERRRGVIAMSAGNHAQAVAYHGRRLGIPTCIVMPRTTPNAKVEQTRVFGAEIVLFGERFDETLLHTEALRAERDLVLVHPFDDPMVIAGQGTLGLEMFEQNSALETVVVPVGGGGLIAGVATALKALAPDVTVVGVQAERYNEMQNWLRTGAPAATASAGRRAATVAEGIAVARPGAITWPIVKALVDDIVTVTEDDIETAMFDLLEVEKSLVEGAGAAALAAVRAYPERFRAAGKTALILSGGNVDMMILSSVLLRGMARSHRLVKLHVEVDDVPGALGALTGLLGELDSNIVDIVHQRAFGTSSVRATLVELVVQMRGEEQADAVLAALRASGYPARLAS